ncbi:MAG TPA: VOC family protein [Kribbellaceae bacterium]|nr:VOC family protein [Kribbellaceae bacterium]
MNHIDHLIYAAPDLENGVREIEERFGVRADGGGQHLGQGTHNKLLALGPTAYLEIIAPDPTQPEPPDPRPYGVDGITHSGLVGWAIACDNIDDSLEAARAAGYDPGEVIEGHRLTASGTMHRWRVTANARTAGVIPFLIRWGDTAHPAAAAPVGLMLESMHIEHPDPESIASPLRALGADVDVRPGARVALVADISGPKGGGQLR